MLSTPRTGVRAVLAAAVTVAVTVALGPAATADHHEPVPTQEQVDRAAGAVADKTRDAAAIQASLLLANQRLEHASILAEVAAERYNAAMWHLSEARAEVKKADARAAAAKQAVADQRDDIAALVTQRYRGGAQLDQLNALFSAEGPSGVMDGYGAVHSVGDTMQAAFDRYRAANALAKVTLAKAFEAKATAQRMAAGARAARDRATSAANEAQTAASSIAAEKSRLLDELATAQGISVRLATQRQSALEEQARERAAAAARTRAEQEAREPAERQAQDKSTQPEGKHSSSPNPSPHLSPGPPSSPTPSPNPSPSPPPSPAPAPPPSPAPSPPPGPSGGANQAIAFAKAQIGEPYSWGAAGPGSWDCSGLTMQAWASAGRSLPHWSVAQYQATSHISSSQLRPGDLLFWGTSSSSSSIHHVAMYLGGGMMIHAPRTGQDVQIVSMYYWIPPNFFGRP